MIQHQGVYLPDGEVHMVDWMTRNGELVRGRGTYQIKKLRRALSYCTGFQVAVDVGAHCGLWSMQLDHHFSMVHAFEPVAAHRECFIANLADSERASSNGAVPGYVLHPCALGRKEGTAVMKMPEPNSTGSTMIDPTAIPTGGNGIAVMRMDDFELGHVDFIKLDCEGSELFALEGGEETIKRCGPVIIVEQKPGRAQRFGLPETGAVDYLASLGYRQAECLSGDYIMVPE